SRSRPTACRALARRWPCIIAAAAGRPAGRAAFSYSPKTILIISLPGGLSQHQVPLNTGTRRPLTMNAQFQAQRETRDYQAADAAHHIHAFLDQKALNA